jgi:XFP N-terminal domain
MTAITEMSTELTDTDLDLLDAYWRAANYLSAGQIYLLDSPRGPGPAWCGADRRAAAGRGSSPARG